MPPTPLPHHEAAMETVRVFWKDKFGGQVVTLNKSDFDPAKHRLEEDGPWESADEVDDDADTPKRRRR